MNYRTSYEETRRLLTEAGIEEADLEARLLLEYVCHTDRNTLLVHGDREVSPKEQERLRELVSDRRKRIPLQQLTGIQNFMGLDFKVNSSVLIPRQDTEILVEEILKELHDGMRILDMCTGSGCILISLMHYSNDCVGLGVDISEKALDTARENAGRLLGDDAKVFFLQSDLFDNVTGRFDLIAANPPYIPSAKIPELMPEVSRYEPHLALDGGEDGLNYYRQIIGRSREYLVRNGFLYFEIGYDQAEAVSAMMRDAGFREVKVVKDYAGLDRVVSGIFIE